MLCMDLRCLCHMTLFTQNCTKPITDVDVQEMLEQAVGNKLDLSKPLVDYEIDNDIIQIYLE